MRLRGLAGWTAALLLAGTAAAVAQEETGRARAGEARREEAFKLVDAYIVSNLQESLGLSDEQYARVLPLVTRLQSQRRGYLMERTRLLRDLRRMLKSGTASEGEVQARLKELKSLEADGPARVRKDMDALDAALSPLQQAKYRVMEQDVEQRLRELLGRVRADRPAAGAPRR